MLSSPAHAQDDDDYRHGKNKKPKITGQANLTMNEGESLTIQMTDLSVQDQDDWFYPFGFTMTLHPGANYTLSGHTVTADAGFEGVLTVPVTVNDGEDDSKPFDLKITVIGTNDPPTITGQNVIAMNEDETLQLQTSHFIISDPDDSDFSINIDDGDHYTVSGASITPDVNYNGQLSVPITVNDGALNSNKFTASVTVSPVNDPPRITAQNTTLSTVSTTPVTLSVEHLAIEDPDNAFPNDFSLMITKGDSYTVSGNDVLPVPDFNGTLRVNVRVSDGAAQSNSFPVEINVRKGQSAPIIISQKPVIINEDEGYTIQFTDLVVIDADSPYPKGFTMNIASGENFTVNNKTVTPTKDFHGNIFPVVTVSDGEKQSEPFRFQITIRPVNDAPSIATTDLDSVRLGTRDETINLIQNFTIQDVDHDHVAMAEIGFEPGSYDPTTDRLTFTGTNNIRGVFDEDAGILALIGKASLQEYTDAIKSIQLTLASQLAVEKWLYILVNDGQANSNQVRKKFIKSEEGAEVLFNIPTGFTPNDDQVNDTWSVTPLINPEGLQQAIIRVYNKAGLMVYESHDLTAAWDGKFNGATLPPDSYFFTIDLKTDAAEKPPVVKGIVTILR